MRILAIETSCDETGIAILDASGTLARPKFRVLSNIAASQIAVHKRFGGVVPNLAKREHQRNLVSVLIKALKEARLRNSNFQLPRLRPGFSGQAISKKLKTLQEIFSHEPELLKNFMRVIPKITPPTIDAIAVTYGPGLAPALWTGVNFARALSLIWKKPLIPVNHLAGHIYVNLIRGKLIHFPALALIVSGGHTELVLMKKLNKYKIIGETQDDAAGEAFDKMAKMLKLGFPRGPAISALADNFKNQKIKNKNSLPRPMLNSKNYDFSFSGLKTAVLYYLRDNPRAGKSQKGRAAIAREFQNAVVETLVAKTIRAAKGYKVKTIILGGGVAANKKLRRDLAAKIAADLPKVNLLLPEVPETTDNALMIGAAAFFARQKKTVWRHLHADPGLRLA